MRTGTKRRFIMGAWSVATLLAACSGGAPRYADAPAIADVLRSSDLGCRDLVQPDISSSGQGSATSSGTCEVLGESVQIFVFETSKEADTWFEQGRMSTVPTARGSNWVVVPQTQDVAERVADSLGSPP